MKREVKWAVVILSIVLIIIVVALLAFRYTHTTYVQAHNLQTGTRDDRPAASVVIRNGFGNQLFEVAALLGYAERHGFQPVLDLNRVSINSYQHSRTLVTDWYDGITIAALDAPEVTIVREAGHAIEYTDLPLPDKDAAALLDGWFQSPKYFPAWETLRRHIRPPPDLVAEVVERWPVVQDPRAVAIHIRRGDYARVAKLMLLDTKEAYYDAALTHMAKVMGASAAHPAPLAVFSDDVFWCRAYFGRIARVDYDITYVCDRRDVHELALMTQFKAHIISNSTFGWWGAVLANSPHVAAPYPWDARSDSCDIYLDHWTLL